MTNIIFMVFTNLMHWIVIGKYHILNLIINVAKMSLNVAINGILMSHKGGFSMSQKIIFATFQK